MSWHCLFCGSSEQWMRGKESNKSGMVEFIIKNEGGKKIDEYVCHADCLRRVLKNGQSRYLINGDLYEFEELEKASEREEEL